MILFLRRAILKESTDTKMPKLRRSRSPASSTARPRTSHRPRTEGGSSPTFARQNSFTAPPEKRVFLHPYKIQYPRTLCRTQHWEGKCSSLLLGASTVSDFFLCSTHTDALVSEARSAAEEEGQVAPTLEEMLITRGQFVTPPYFDQSTACQSCDREWCERGVGAAKRGVSLVLPENPAATSLPEVSWFCHDCGPSLRYHLGQLRSSGYNVIQSETLETLMTEQHFVPDTQ